MRIYKRGDHWWIDFRFRGRRYRELSGHSREVALRYLVRRRAEVEEGVLVPTAAPITLREWSESFMKWSKLKKSSWTRDRSSIAQLLPVLGSMRLTEITAREIERYQARRLRDTTRFDRPPEVRRQHAIRAASALRKLTFEQVKEIRAARAAGERTSEVAQRFGVLPSTVCDVVKGRIYRGAA